MTKDEFLNKLNEALRGLSLNERQDILQDYQEHFVIGLEEGKTEAEIAERLGSPNSIAKELLASYHIERVEQSFTAGNIIRAIWAVIGLGFFNLIIVLGPFIAIVGVIFTLWVASLGFTLAPLLVIFDFLVHPGTFEFFNLFVSIGLCGLGILLGLGMFFVTKVFTKGFIRYLKFNVSLVRGGLKHE
ncbi:HAAS signaling domain-containing protein [Heyndrickxia camelliae]|uniref:DUF1700 domain-containing protein n=1 Tax=Heyndrickxia camelliae TaxID=1707093 RepID=A0A2N3LQ61_9BACI|nr:DUF1700 domain-containing protein [Heyndrickxia camelliae]PKR86812.1 hypothetical protein CWO92_01775 [Heyndrickxia camelliae]